VIFPKYAKCIGINKNRAVVHNSHDITEFTVFYVASDKIIKLEIKAKVDVKNY